MRITKLFSSALLCAGLISPAVQGAAPAAPTGLITAKAFLNIGGTVVSDLTGNAKFPNSPDAVYYWPYFEWNPSPDGIGTPSNNAFGENYGGQMLGYFYPPSNGDYVFYISADDGAALYLSTDDTPANKKLIAQESGWSNPRKWVSVGGGSTIEAKNSSTFAGTQWATKDTASGGAKITLTANRPYYIEALFKEGGGGDNLAVLVKLPGGADPADDDQPMEGKYLAAFGVPDKPTIVGQPKDAAVLSGNPATFTVGLDIPPTATLTSIKWTKNGTDIPDSNTNRVTIVTAGADNGAKIKAIVTTSAGVLESSEATLNVATLTSEFAGGVVKAEFFNDIGSTAVDALTGADK